MPLPRDPPQGVRHVSRNCRRSGEIPGIISRRGMQGGSSKPAIVPLKANLFLLGESEGVSARKGTRPAPAGNVGSYSSDLVSIRKYGDYLGGGSQGPYLCGEWEWRRAKCRPMIHEYELVVCSVDATANSLSSFDLGWADADGSFGQERAIERGPIWSIVHYRGWPWRRFEPGSRFG